MSMTEILKEIEQEVADRRQEHETLETIAVLTTPEYAQQAAQALDSRKHPYSYGAYLVLLDNLKQLLLSGMPCDAALDAVQCGLTGGLKDAYNINHQS